MGGGGEADEGRPRPGPHLPLAAAPPAGGEMCPHTGDTRTRRSAATEGHAPGPARHLARQPLHSFWLCTPVLP